MKKLITILFLLIVTVSVKAQDETDGMDQKTRSKVEAARIAYITERLGLTPDEAEKFWPVYREFGQKRQEIRKEYNEARKNGKPENELVELGLKVKQRELDLEKEYSGRLMNTISAQKLITLRSAEREFTQILIKQIQQRQIEQQRQQQIRDRNEQRNRQRNN